MDNLNIDDFAEFFEAIHGYEPLAWQMRLAQLASDGRWPDVVDLPTGSGKTAILDIATFALAMQADHSPQDRTAPLRTFLVVDRRIVVDDAYRRAKKIAQALANATGSETALGRVARRLSELSCGGVPVSAYQLRGGIYRETAWVKSARQPMLITSTVDQVGSRLLFRGYGVSNASQPIHAAIVGCDSLIVLDEAHCSRAFAQTLVAVRSYQATSFSTEHIPTPRISIEMTATPSISVPEDRRFSLLDDERSNRNTLLGRRLHQSKPTKLMVVSKAKGKNAIEAFATEVVTQAKALISGERKAIAIVVNRIKTAKLVFAKLQATVPIGDNTTVELMIGRMRSIDRDKQAKRLSSTIASSCSATERPSEPLFVVATQCIEVGADLDFDGLVSEAAPLDALRQRFGRLNRTARNVDSVGVVMIQEANVLSSEQLDTLDGANKADDPVYGNSLARTWNAIWDVAKQCDDFRQIDFGISALDQLIPRLEAHATRQGLTTNSLDAPVLLPSHLDLLCQTSCPPWPDPEVAIWLHGAQRASADVQICWRADLPIHATTDSWAQAVSLCPPTSAECMQVPITAIKSWLVEQDDGTDDMSDLPSGLPTNVKNTSTSIVAERRILRWRGMRESEILTDANDLRPGDTLILPVSAFGWNELGYIPHADYAKNATVRNHTEYRGEFDFVDCSEDAFTTARNRLIVKLPPFRFPDLGNGDAGEWLRSICMNDEEPFTRSKIRDQCQELYSFSSSPISERLARVTRKRFQLDRYVGQNGIVITAISRDDSAEEVVEDDGDDSVAYRSEGRITLVDHLKDVERQVLRESSSLPIRPWIEAICIAARMHDWGKVDPRFQAMLIRGNPQSVYFQPFLWAKSGELCSSRKDWLTIKHRAELPDAFRHEMLSVQLAAQSINVADQQARDLILHLIASHHGNARPFVPVSVDNNPADVSLPNSMGDVSLSSAWRAQHPPERLDSGIPERFWRGCRRFGWWGLAYLEMVIRLADQAVSANPSQVIRSKQEVLETSQ